MTLLSENFENPVLAGYLTDGNYGNRHSDIRSMRQIGTRGVIPLHCLTRNTLAELANSTDTAATPVSDIQINTRRPGDCWVSTYGSIIEREKPGLKPEIGFQCDTAGAVNEFTSTIVRPFFSLSDEPLNYSINLSSYSPTDIVYLTANEVSPDIDLTQSWVMFSDIENAPLNDPSWIMIPLSGVGVTQTGRQISFELSLLSPLLKISSVRFSLKNDGASGSIFYASELGIRGASTVWNPMQVDTRIHSLVRSASNQSGDVLGPIPTTDGNQRQPQMIWSVPDSSPAVEAKALGGTFIADFNTGSLPPEEPSAIRLRGGNVSIKPVDNANLTHEMSANFSIGCWVQLSEESLSDLRPMGIVAKYVEPDAPATSHGSYRLGIVPVVGVTTVGEIVFQLDTETYTTTGAGLVPNVWYFIAVTRDVDQLKIYVNSVQIGSTFTVSSSVVTDDLAPFSIGTWSNP